MSYKIQITVDEKLNRKIKAGAEQIGLSVSSYARLVLMNVLQRKKDKLLDQAMEDIDLKRVSSLNLEDFNRQIDDL